MYSWTVDYVALLIKVDVSLLIAFISHCKWVKWSKDLTCADKWTHNTTLIHASSLCILYILLSYCLLRPVDVKGTHTHTHTGAHTQTLDITLFCFSFFTLSKRASLLMWRELQVSQNQRQTWNVPKRLPSIALQQSSKGTNAQRPFACSSW